MKFNPIYLFLGLSTLLFQANLKTYAQDASARTGIRGGLNVSNLYIKDVTDRNPRYGFHVGLFTQVPLIKGMLYLQPEVGYSTKGVAARYNLLNGTFRGQNTFKMDYFEIPVLATLKVGNFVDIHGGLYGGFLVNASTESKSDAGFNATVLNRDNFNNFDYGLAAGLSIYFGKIMLATRYNYGLRPVASSTAAKVFLDNAKNSAAQLSIGYTF
ncbi:porin family protein [Runella zeae]|uniref:porin family protein n=1 Tax=Runella zeae TaxID=94255 RepID=UPI0023536C35|nr:porin family protein [Runella zeae]